MWRPQFGGQLTALDADWCDELFFGGERGGGKSEFQLGYQEDGAMRYKENWRGIMFRKTYPELEELQARALEIFPSEGAVFKTQPSAEFPFSNCWYWPNKASVKMRYIEIEKDYGRYHGHSYTGISFDEVTEYASPVPLLKMISTLRSATGTPCTLRATGNPGGIGHAWVKDRYITSSPPLIPYDDPETGFTRLFIPSRMQDNKILLDKDPGYKNRLLAATNNNEVLRKAWLEGDWDVTAGSALKLTRKTHMLRSFTPPQHWTRFTSLDWGYVRPYANGWYAVAEGGTLLRGRDGGEDMYIPDKAVVMYRELYGSTGQPNEGSREESPTVAKKILDIEVKAAEKMDYRVADTQLWAKNDGPSMAERMFEATKGGFNPRKAIKDRQANYNEFCNRLKGVELEDETWCPMFFITENCLNFWRTVPTLILDEINPEKGPDEKQELHAYDQAAYGLASRPFVTTVDQRIDREFYSKRKLMRTSVDPYRVKKIAGID